MLALWSTALASAEALAIFGREGVDLATMWVAPAAGSATENAFKLFLNYDGAKSNVFGASISATSTSSTVTSYAIKSTDKTKLFVLLFNKGTASQTVDVNLVGVSPAANANKYSFARNSALASRGTIAVANNRVTTTLAQWEACLLVVPVTSQSGMRVEEDPSTSTQSLSAGPIAGIVVGCVVGVLLVAVVGFLIMKQIRRPSTTERV